MINFPHMSSSSLSGTSYHPLHCLASLVILLSAHPSTHISSPNTIPSSIYAPTSNLPHDPFSWLPSPTLCTTGLTQGKERSSLPCMQTIVCILTPAPPYPYSQAWREGAWFQQSAHGTYRFNHVLFSGRVAVTPLKSRSWLYDIAIHRIKLASLSSFCLSALANTLVLLLNKDLYHKKADGCAMEAQVTLFHQ